MSSFVDKLKRIAKKNKMVKKVYLQAKNSFITTQIGEITPLLARRSENQKVRFNLLVPSINKEHIFGGISTAIKFFNELVPEGYDRRIIITDANPNHEDIADFYKFQLISAEQDSDITAQVIPFNDRYQKTIPVRKSDIFIATAWWTAYGAQRLVEWQELEYNQKRHKMIYFIQDYEPCFYPWSSQFILAESTYKYDGPQIAVFNTKLLQNYVVSKGYNFYKQYSFEPQMNTVLKKHLELNQLHGKKKRILLYGRPSVSRNAFPLIMESLRIWSWKLEDIRDWEVISVGESHPDVDVGNGVIVRSCGKLSLEEYTKELSESAVGVSLMISPHPSYPPLEMAHYGMLVLTNTYENKNLSEFHSNITSVDIPTPENISAMLAELCKKFSKDNLVGLNREANKSYLSESDAFPFINNIISDILDDV